MPHVTAILDAACPPDHLVNLDFLLRPKLYSANVARQCNALSGQITIFYYHLSNIFYSMSASIPTNKP